MRIAGLTAFLVAFSVEAGPWTKTLQAQGITDPRVLAAFDAVRRADYLPEDMKAREMEDRPLPIGDGQTTSQPSLIAMMIQQLQLPKDCKVLEIGTGSGYQTALLAHMCREVYSIEIVAPLAERAKQRLAQQGVKNAHVKAGDGYQGWPEAAPFDGITVGAGAAKIPQPLVQQLEKKNGRMVIPAGEQEELSLQIVRADGKIERSIPVRFVPLTGTPAERDRARK